MSIDDLLSRGIAAVKEGRRDEARRLLAQALEQDKGNEMAWLWMSGAVETDAERLFCLENVLKINSSNTIARRGLERLRTSPGVSPLPTALLHRHRSAHASGGSARSSPRRVEGPSIRHSLIFRMS